jgi:hypothetical protein
VQPRVRRAQHYEDDRTWSFGCFGLLGFLSALVAALSRVDATLGGALLAAVAVGLIAGLLAAVGGPRVREWLWWLWYLLP